MKTVSNWFLSLLLLAVLTLSAAGADPSSPVAYHTDPVSGMHLPIPAGLRLVESGMKGDRSYAVFSFGEAGAPLIRYTCEDVWGKLPFMEQVLFSRRQADTSEYYYKVDHATEYGVPFLSVSKVHWAKWLSLRIDIPENTTLSTGELITEPSTVFLVYQYGYKHEFWLTDSGESEYLPAMEELAHFVRYVNRAAPSDAVYFTLFAFPLFVFFLAAQIFRLSVRQAGELTGKTRRVAALHGLLTFLCFLPGGLALCRFLTGFHLSLFYLAALALLAYASSFPGKEKELLHRRILLPALPLGTYHRIFLLANAFFFLWRGIGQRALLLFGTEVTLLAISCAFPMLILRTSIRETFHTDKKALLPALGRGGLAFAFTALLSWLVRFLLPISLLFLAFSALFLLLSLCFPRAMQDTRSP